MNYTISATVSGLTGTLVLQDNGSDNLTITANGTFPFATQIAGGGYIQRHRADSAFGPDLHVRQQ